MGRGCCDSKGANLEDTRALGIINLVGASPCEWSQSRWSQRRRESVTFRVPRPASRLFTRPKSCNLNARYCNVAP
jgi:hypothetical protein